MQKGQSRAQTLGLNKARGPMIPFFEIQLTRRSQLFSFLVSKSRGSEKGVATYLSLSHSSTQIASWRLS